MTTGDLGTGAAAPDLDAGDFSSWMTEIRGALRGTRVAQVPCGGCTACCTSSQFVHIGPDETATLARIPKGLLFPAPRLPRGHLLLGYDERGHCPMLIDDRCSIYEDRPRACRTYDCRVFPASGVSVDDGAKARIARQARRWRFAFATEADRTRRDAVQAMAAYLEEHADLFTRPPTATQLAVLAVELHEMCLGHDAPPRAGAGGASVVEPDGGAVRSELARRQR